VIGNLTGALSRKYVCEGCNRGCDSSVTHKCEETCTDCLSVPPCPYSNVRIPCTACNRQFRSRVCFDKHKTNRLQGKTVCEKKRNCTVCNTLLMRRHECFKPFCPYCRQNKEIEHFCYMPPLENVLPCADKVLFVFYDFETTQDTKFSEDATEHVPILVCLQQFCSVCEKIEDIDTDCERCGRRRHSFFEDPVGDLLSYLTRPRPWCNKVVVIAHNAKAFDAHFILKRAIFLKWEPKLIMNGLKILSMQMEHLHFLDSVNYLPMPLRKLPEAFGLASSKSWYPHYFNTQANLDYVGPIPDTRYYGADEMGWGREGTFYLGTKCRKTRSLIIDTCWSNTAKMMSRCYAKPVRPSDAILWRSVISTSS